ncbi:DUF997 family protein [Orbaceae bacterium ESL0721]|nr:DUF997 family protein [Orbaceae bacterium ESL0721]
MDRRYKQANREAILSLILTFIYLFAWFIGAYCVGSGAGFFGLPLWFELSTICAPIGFILICWVVVKYQFKLISLD